MTKGTSHETALVDEDGAGIWVGDDGGIGLDEFHGQAGACIGFSPTPEQRVKLARLLVKELPPEARADLCRRLLWIEDGELEYGHAVIDQFELDNDPDERLSSLIAKLEGTQ